MQEGAGEAVQCSGQHQDLRSIPSPHNSPAATGPLRSHWPANLVESARPQVPERLFQKSREWGEAQGTTS